MARCHLLLAALFLRTGDYALAEKHCGAAIYLSTWELADRKLEGDSWNNLGLVHKNVGFWDLAETDFKKALDAYAGMDNPLPRVRSLLNLAILLRKKGSLGKAYDLCNEGLHLAKELGLPLYECSYALELANVSLTVHDDRQAEQFITHATEIAQKNQQRREQVLALELEGDLWSARKEYRRALSIYGKALRLARQLAKGGDLECEIARRAASAALCLNRIKSAKRLVNLAVGIAQRIGDEYELAICLRILGQVEIATGTTGCGLQHIRDSVEKLMNLSVHSAELAASELTLAKALLEAKPESSNGTTLEHLITARRIYSHLGVRDAIAEIDNLLAGLVTPPKVGGLRSSLEESRHPSGIKCYEDILQYGIVTADERIAGDLKQWGPTDVRVLIEGETGVGKELLAQAMHGMSRRREEPFVVIDCGSLSETLAESELFGHARGAFTGAVRERVGLIESANGGTLFLDEVGELSEALQVKLLRVLEEGSVRRVGSNEPRKIDVRVLSATTRDLWHEVEAGKFRKDLYYRLKGVLVRIPSLRERPYDIELLIDYYLDQYCTSYGVRVTLSEEARQGLLTYSWPGNVRELKNVIEALVAIGRSRVIQPSDLDQFLGTCRRSCLLEQAEKDAIRLALKQARGNRTKAAKILGISRGTLWHRMRSLGMD